MLKVLKKAAALSRVTFEVSNLTILQDSKGDDIFVLTLEEPIPHVRGSQDIKLNDRVIPVEMSNVHEVKIHSEDMKVLSEAYEKALAEDPNTPDPLDLNDNNEGTYDSTVLKLDVSKNKECWLKAIPFNIAGQNYRSERVNQRNQERANMFLGVPSSKVGA